VEKAALQIAVADLYLPGEDEPRRVAMEAAAFDKLATDKAMSELLITARPARRSAKSSTPSAARADRGSYASLENAGKPHKGKITDVEQQLVREHFDQINERLAAEGLRTISLTDPEHVERYGLAELAEQHGADKPGTGKPAPQQHSADKPGAEQHSADKPGADKPGADKPGADKPGADKPGADKPGADKPGAGKPSADKPSADKPVAKSVPVPAASAV
jgi:hypothetical protein